MIGFYVHHHGAGHWSRTAAVVAAMDEPVAILTSSTIGRPPANAVLCRLEPDSELGIGDPTAGGALHWAPIGSDRIKRRAAAIVEWLTRPEAALLVSDVSVEVLTLARLCGVPTVAVRDQGNRNDRAHRFGYDLATAIMAPFPAELDDDHAVPGLKRRTTYLGLYHRWSGRRESRAGARTALGLDTVAKMAVVCLGAGGADHAIARLHEMARACTDWQVVVIGALAPVDAAIDNLRFAGWVDDPYRYLCAADVVIGHGGANLVAEVAGADRPFICLPQDRPHDEQRARARRLDALGAATIAITWPDERSWPGLIERALTVGSATLHKLAEGAHPRTTAEWLLGVADRPPSGVPAHMGG